ncbi:MAG: SpoVR family protein [Armatimonadota bacterium]|nr:SpoVR family protein [Armatimonadota bacterium]MDR7451658.1 SpoVR family protein [Armatimonadota bacterium]MDR7465724.1 SpoVR family protein [Armatimonadota bacterium]MDR7493632.1 SpoVR family protein [Armatimonadota bacterium]MDR7499119.1 SpoVR family protein [Armatimonadota bacterium]
MEPYRGVIDRIEGLARERGLSFDPVVFRLTDSDELAEVASMGLPNRFIHWYWGGAYKELTLQQNKEVFSILELVLNTNPSYAFLRGSNTYLQNVLVIAHVFGHVDFFKNNHWYRKSNKNMLNEAELHARTIRKYEATYGRERVEPLLDAVLTVSRTVNAFERNPAARRRLLIYALEERAPLEEWERHILAMIREEAEYFDLIQRTHIINEGWATFVEAELLREVLTSREWASVGVQLCNRPAPYTIGYALFQRVKNDRGFDRALEIRTYYEDIRLIDEVLTEEMVRALDIFVYDPKEKQKSYDLQRVKEMLITQKLFKGEPYIEVEPGPHQRELVLVHRDEERKLDSKRVGLFLKAVYLLWRNPVRLRANGKLYTYDRRGFSTT